MTLLIGGFVIYFGIAGVIWFFLIGLFYPKTDKRYRTGYKYNKTPNMEKIKSFNKGYWIFISTTFVLISIFTAFNIDSFSNQTSAEVKMITVYEHPDNKSRKTDSISQNTNYKIIKDTKYFHYINYQDSLRGYILK